MASRRWRFARLSYMPIGRMAIPRPSRLLVFELLFQVAFDSLVDCLDLAVGLRMSRRGEGLADLQLIADISYSRVVKLCSVVGHNRGGDTVPAYDVLPDEVRRVCFSYSGKRLGLYPLSEVVNGDNGIFVLPWRSRKLANDVHAPFSKGTWDNDAA